MDLKTDLIRLFHRHKMAVSAALITVFIFCAVYACSGVRYLIRLHDISNQTPAYSTERLYYNHLNARQQLLYDAIYRAAQNGDQKTQTLLYRYTQEEYATVMSYLTADCPSLFYLNSAACSLRNGWNSAGVQLSYYAEPSVLADMQSRFETTVSDIIAQIGTYSTETAYAEAIHDYLILHCTVSESGGIADTAYGAIVEGSATGMGYAQAFKTLTNACGLYCVTVYGAENGRDLAWNLIYTDGHFYHTDVSFDDPDWTEPVLFHGFFGIGDEQVAVSRTVRYPDVLPVANTDSTYYAQNGLEADSVSEMREILIEQLLKAAKNDGHFIELRITFSNDIRLFEDVIGEALQQANRLDANAALRDSFRIFTSTDANGAATIEIFYYDH